MPKTHPRRYRIEALILQALAPLLTSVLPGCIVTLRHVSLSKDFGIARVVYTVVGEEPGKVQQLLEENAWRYRQQLATTLNMRKTPQLNFLYDSEGLAADKMRAFLEHINLDDS